MNSKTQIFGSARFRKRERNNTRTEAFHHLVNRTNVRFRYTSTLNSNTGSPTSSRPKSGDPLNWEMFAIWAFVVFSFAALAFALLVIWLKCGRPSPL